MSRVKAIREKAHRAFDPLWQRGYLSRRQAYDWLASVMGLVPGQAHIGELTEHQCYQLITLAEKELEEFRNGKGARTHELKLWPAQFRAVQQGRKMYDLRRENRIYREGDHVTYREFDPGTRVFTGATITVDISYVTRDAAKHGLEPGHVILGLQFPASNERAG